MILRAGIKQPSIAMTIENMSVIGTTHQFIFRFMANTRRDISAAIHTPVAAPNVPPNTPSISDSPTNSRITSPGSAPRAFFNPISLERSEIIELRVVETAIKVSSDIIAETIQIKVRKVAAIPVSASDIRRTT